jgi:hypothetical protein
MKNFSRIISYATLLACLYTKISWIIYSTKFTDIKQATAAFHVRFPRNYLLFLDLFSVVAAYYFFTGLQTAESKGFKILNGLCFGLISLYVILDIWQFL